jgi:hypothetical protein
MAVSTATSTTNAQLVRSSEGARELGRHNAFIVLIFF